MKQGQSLSTRDKERQLAAMFDINLRIVKKKCPGEIYHHIDLNAGSGWNDEFGVEGSPLVFIRLAEQYLDDRWVATFYELDERRAEQLWSRLRGIPRCTVLPLDNAQFRERAKWIGNQSVGSVLVDPNGWLNRTAKGIGCPPLDELCAFFKTHQRMDFIANLNLHFYQQARGAMKNHPRHPDYSRLPSLTDMPKLLSKRFGLISNRSNNGHSTFVRLILRNIYTNDYRAMGWHQKDSLEAQAIYDYAEGLSSKSRNQLDLDLGEATA